MKKKYEITWFNHFLLFFMIMIIIFIAWFFFINSNQRELTEQTNNDDLKVANEVKSKNIKNDSKKVINERFKEMNQEEKNLRIVNQYVELKKLFSESPFVIESEKLIIDENNNKHESTDSAVVIRLALKSIVGRINVPDGSRVVVKKEEGFSTVIIENKLPKGVRGGSFTAKIKIDTSKMKVIEAFVDS